MNLGDAVEGGKQQPLTMQPLIGSGKDALPEPQAQTLARVPASAEGSGTVKLVRSSGTGSPVESQQNLLLLPQWNPPLSSGSCC